MSFASSKSRWFVNRTNQEYVDYVSRLSGLPSPLSQVLINRGIKTADQLDSFLNPRITMLSDPFDISGMRPAVGRILQAIHAGETIIIHGDYDADGVTATAILVDALGRLGTKPLYYIPDRRFGYGLGAEGINKAREAGASLIITVDCGITSFDAIAAAKSYGIDVIVTDHHEPMRDEGPARTIILPDAIAIINPKLTSYESSFSNLSGAGVAFKLAQALNGNNLDKVIDLIDLAAIGTAADIVPVIGDNRIILKEGLLLIQTGNRRAIRALKQISGIASGPIRASSLHYMLVPRINAAGRIDYAGDVVKFMLTESGDEATRLAEWLDGLNTRRQEIGDKVYGEAMEMLHSQNIDQMGAIVVAKEGWHCGVLGIVSARITDCLYKPSFVLSVKDGIAKGSARSIPPFDIHEGLCRCSGVLHAFGGHKQAAGLTLAASDIDIFKTQMSRLVLETVKHEDMVPALSIDAQLMLSDVNAFFIQEMARLEPFGCGNEEPLFGAKGLEIYQSRIVGNNHLKVYLKQNGKGMEGIGFGLGSMIDMAEPGALVDAAFVPVMNEWEGGRNLQLYLKSVRTMKSMSER